MKICNHEACKYNQFGGGYCKYHQSKRISKSNKRSVGSYKPNPKKTTYKKRTKSKSAKTILKNKEKKDLHLKDLELWNEIWQERLHVDFETNEPIYGEPLTLYFHHILPKAIYPEYRFKKWNIVIISWDTHAQAEAHCKLPKLDAYKIKLLKTKIK